MDLEFHDQPPAGVRAAADLQAFMEALRANPGKWAKLPTRQVASVPTSLSKAGFKTALRNWTTETPKRADLWAMWPGPVSGVKPTPTPASTTINTPSALPASRPAAGGKQLECSACDFVTDVTHAKDLDRHCRIVHNRPSYKAERMPVDAGDDL